MASWEHDGWMQGGQALTKSPDVSWPGSIGYFLSCFLDSVSPHENCPVFNPVVVCPDVWSLSLPLGVAAPGAPSV